METITQYGEPEKLLKLPFGFDTCLFFSSGIVVLAQVIRFMYTLENSEFEFEFSSVSLPVAFG
jgi:hypothetical protein